MNVKVKVKLELFVEVDNNFGSDATLDYIVKDAKASAKNRMDNLLNKENKLHYRLLEECFVIIEKP